MGSRIDDNTMIVLTSMTEQVSTTDEKSNMRPMTEMVSWTVQGNHDRGLMSRWGRCGGGEGDVEGVQTRRQIADRGNTNTATQTHL